MQNTAANASAACKQTPYKIPKIPCKRAAKVYSGLKTTSIAVTVF